MKKLKNKLNKIFLFVLVIFYLPLFLFFCILPKVINYSFIDGGKIIYNCAERNKVEIEIKPDNSCKYKRGASSEHKNLNGLIKSQIFIYSDTKTDEEVVHTIIQAAKDYLAENDPYEIKIYLKENSMSSVVKGYGIFFPYGYSRNFLKTKVKNIWDIKVRNNIHIFETIFESNLDLPKKFSTDWYDIKSSGWGGIDKETCNYKLNCKNTNNRKKIIDIALSGINHFCIDANSENLVNNNFKYLNVILEDYFPNLIPIAIAKYSPLGVDENGKKISKWVIKAPKTNINFYKSVYIQKNK
ncbi:hypothetical protein LJT99_07395 [Lentisphaerae bacterium WC36]|nr:hypothetical protein LJT99_07395 [Lentisphaerae bacterium WC36]